MVGRFLALVVVILGLGLSAPAQAQAPNRAKNAGISRLGPGCLALQGGSPPYQSVALADGWTPGNLAVSTAADTPNACVGGNSLLVTESTDASPVDHTLFKYQPFSMTANLAHTTSFYVKRAAGSPNLAITMTASNGNLQGSNINLATCSRGGHYQFPAFTYDAANHKYSDYTTNRFFFLKIDTEQLSNGWCRVSATWYARTTETNLQVMLVMLNASQVSPYQGAGSAALQFWGMDTRRNEMSALYLDAQNAPSTPTGKYFGYMGDWSKFTAPQTTWRPASQYEDWLQFDPANFDSRGEALISYRWPNSGCSTGVCGYMFVAQGNYNSGTSSFPAVTPRQVSAISTFTSTWDETSLSGQPDDGGFLHEFYLTTTQNDLATKVMEIGAFTFTNAAVRTYATGSGTFKGDWIDATTGWVWKIYDLPGHGDSGHYVMAIPPVGQESRLKGSIDFKGLMTFLTTVTLTPNLNTSWWFNGVAIGIEPANDAGAMKVNDWKLVYN
jgi:hypothetical protein